MGRVSTRSCLAMRTRAFRSSLGDTLAGTRAVPDVILGLKPRSARGRNRPRAKLGGSASFLVPYRITSRVNGATYACRVTIMSYGNKTHLRFRGREVYPTEGSCRFSLIVLQQTTQSFSIRSEGSIHTWF